MSDLLKCYLCGEKLKGLTHECPNHLVPKAWSDHVEAQKDKPSAFEKLAEEGSKGLGESIKIPRMSTYEEPREDALTLAERRIYELENALLKYGGHLKECVTLRIDDEYDAVAACECGFSKVLNP